MVVVANQPLRTPSGTFEPLDEQPLKPKKARIYGSPSLTALKRVLIISVNLKYQQSFLHRANFF